MGSKCGQPKKNRMLTIMSKSRIGKPPNMPSTGKGDLGMEPKMPSSASSAEFPNFKEFPKAPKLRRGIFNAKLDVETVSTASLD